MRPRLTWLTEQERTLIYEEALGILSRIGMRLAGSRSFSRLRDGGALVDEASGVARFPASMVETALSRLPPHVVMAGATAAYDVVLDRSGITRFNPSGCFARTIDMVTGELRASSLQDLHDGVRVMDETSQLELMWTFITANDVPLERRELLEYYYYLTETAKPLVFVDCPTMVEPVRRIFEVLGDGLTGFRERPRVGVLCAARSPLGVHGELLDLTCQLASLGAPVWAYSMPMSGATAPVTIAGTLAMIWAEILGLVTAIQTLAPGAPVVACCGPGILDMRQTTMSLGSPETTIMGAASIEIGHSLGLPTHNSGLSTDAKHPGIQAGYEKGLKLALAMATGADVISGGFGALDSSSAFFLPMVPIDAEIVEMARRLVGEVEVSGATLMADAFDRVGIGGDFLKEKATRTRIRAGEHFMPRIASRASLEAWLAEGRTEIDVARERVAELLASWDEHGPYLSGDQRRELAAICGIL